MFALLDGNNFYASCERVFRPSLKGIPLIILSNNDGCAIARSEEAKALGVKMGQPYFELLPLVHTQGLVALSANFSLYGDMSDRMMSIVSAMGPEQEIYSIDECFIGLHGVPGITKRAQAISERIHRGVGIPNCVGIGPTKTLAKLANHIAKSAERKPGSYPPHLGHVCNLAEISPEMFQYVLKQTPVGEVWGVGRKIAKRLAELNICTALDLSRMPLPMARKHFSIVLERTVLELQGIVCMQLETQPPPKQQIACTRSFGHPVTTLPPLIQAVSEFATRAAEKLRKQEMRAGAINVFAHTSPFRSGARFYKSASVQLQPPTSDTKTLVNAAVRGISQIYEPGYQLSKAGVMLMDLCPGIEQQADLPFALPINARDASALMEAMDKINARFGKGAVHVASTGQADQDKSGWHMKQERKTPLYTTCLDDIPTARA